MVLRLDDTEIVISGISGRFPSSDNLEELWENLVTGTDLIIDNHERFNVDQKTMPSRMGIVRSLEKFDADFFAVHGKQSDILDPRTRKLLEVSYEAVMDAGINPAMIKGTNTGVFIGGSESEAGGIWRRSSTKMNFYGVLGNVLSMMANRVSFFFGFNGPSYVVDTACSASSVALQQALLNIRTGQCDAAIVGAAHLHHDPAATYMFHQLEMTNREGRCKVFDTSADGYVRSEAIVAIYICKKDMAKRSYATLVHAVTNNDGYKEQGITFPSVVLQERVIRRVYEDSGIDPLKVDYIEAHGTGTKVGDPEEMTAVTNVFCNGRKGPLLVGSVKSNMGHTETASGLCSIAKIILSYTHGIIPANLHFNEPNPDIPGLLDGRLQVVDKNMPFNPTYVGMSSMGFGGTNVHVLLKMNPRREETPLWEPQIPVIILCSGRNQEGIEHFLQKSLTHRQNRNFVSLLHELTKNEIPRHTFKGYVVIEPEKMEVVVERQEPKRQVWFIFPGLGSQWLGMSRDLSKFDVFRKSLDASIEYLAKNEYDLANVFQSEDIQIFDNLKNAVVPITAVQLALVDLLKHVAIESDGIIGHSTGEVASGYADGCLTHEQTVLVALARARGVLESDCPPGTVASVGLSWEEAGKRCPEGIYPVIHNAKENVTIAGSPEAVKSFVGQLDSEGVFAKAVRGASYGFHSPLVSPSGPVAQKILEKVIPEPKERSKKWLSSSVPEDKWDTDLAKYCSPEYYVNNGVKPVYFYPALLHIPEQAIALELAPHCFMQTILKQSLPASVVTMGFIHCKSPDNSVYFLNSLGKCYLAGINVDVGALYEPVQFPITDNTPIISSMIRWEHSTVWDVPHHTKELSKQRGTKYSFHLLMDTDAFLEGHCVDGKIVFPATGYLWLVWTFFAHQHGRVLEIQPVVFENVRFERITMLNKRNMTDFLINILVGSGKFEIVESDMVVCSGVIRELDESLENEIFDYSRLKDVDTTGPFMVREDFYNEMHLRGFGHTGQFQGVKEVDMQGKWANVEWNGHWISFMDSLLHPFVVRSTSRDLHVPIRIEKVSVDPIQVLKSLQENNNTAVLKIFDTYKTGCITGVELKGVCFAKVPRRNQSVKATTSESIFIPYLKQPAPLLSEDQALESSLETVIENSSGDKFVFAEIFNCIDNMISHKFINQLLLKFRSFEFRTVNESKEVPEEENLNKSGTCVIALEDLKSRDQNRLIFVDCEERVADAENLLLPNGFLLFKGGSSPKISNPNIKLILERSIKNDEGEDNERFYLYRQVQASASKKIIIPLSENDYAWVDAAKKAIQGLTTNDRLIFTSTAPYSGIIGFTKCIIREVSSELIRSFHAIDSIDMDFSNPNKLLQVQLEQDLVFNVYKNGYWGSFNNLLIPEAELLEKRIMSSHVYGDALQLGQLSSLTWIESPLKLSQDELIAVNFAALNFRDIMLASGKLVEDVVMNKKDQITVLGLEFSGTYKGKRVCGIAKSECLASYICPKTSLLFDIPDTWTFAEGATVPAVYITVYYSLVNKANIKEGESILIHAGSGGVGQAAIAVALSMKCKVFTTVSTQEKRDFLKARFPALTDESFASSRDAKDFERHVYEHTDSNGVDIVLNSLAQDKLFASIRCLARNGRFLEIGKFDIVNNTSIGMSALAKGASIFGIQANDLTEEREEIREELKNCVNEKIKSGVIIPLSHTVFQQDQLEEAFRYMGQGKHIGKVIIKVKEDDATSSLIPALPRTYFNKTKSYIIVGGLGGMGFELVDWLIKRGAQHIVISSRSGVKSTYHEYHINIWERQGINIVIDRSDASRIESARHLLTEAKKLGPVGGIFNTALVLKDALFNEQTPEAFGDVIGCKADATKNFDALSRQFAPELDHFVVFSSIVSARGNPAQTNYGLANSAMERICEQRHADGLPALAMQWGAVGDVGVVHRTMKDRSSFFGLVPQKFQSCLATLDLCLQQNKPVISSFITAQMGDLAKINPNDSLVNIAAQILGIKDLTKVNPKTPLVDLGMDSIMAAELSQALATKRNIQMSKKEYSMLNFEKLAELDKNEAMKDRSKSVESWVSQKQQQQTQLDTLLKLKIIEGTGVTKMKSLATKAENVFMVHPIDGTVAMLETLVSSLNATVYGVECVKDAPLESMGKLADFYLQRIKEVQPHGPFKIAGYSFGASVAFEMVRKLEEQNETVSLLLLLDSSPKYKTFIKYFKGDDLDKEDWENAVILKFLRHYICPIPHTVGTDLHNIDSLAPKCSYVARLLQETQPDLSLDIIKELTLQFKLRADCEKMYQAKGKVSARTVLIKALKSEDEGEIPFDYGLAEVCEEPVEVIPVDGNHFCFYEKIQELGLPEIINRVIE